MARAGRALSKSVCGTPLLAPLNPSLSPGGGNAPDLHAVPGWTRRLFECEATKHLDARNWASLFTRSLDPPIVAMGTDFMTRAYPLPGAIRTRVLGVPVGIPERQRIDRLARP